MSGNSKSYFYQVPRELVEKRDMMVSLFNEVGMLPVIPEAGYFMVVDISEMGGYAEQIPVRTVI